MSKTRIFISSTCYDLSQIRKDLKEGIEVMGHEAVLSENMDFPINPSLTSVENCVEAVRNDIDVFVLIIGNKYGCKLESGKSITNSEFLTALELGIPVYTFSLKKMVNLLPIWKSNKGLDFGDAVDDVKVFEFLEDVREKRSKWNFEFESAQDILEILKSQLSILFKQSLKTRKTVESYDNGIVSAISSKALKILVDKPEGYEILFYLQMMHDEISKYRYLKKDCIHAITVKSGGYLSDPRGVHDWLEEKLLQVSKLIESLNSIFTAFEQYFGPRGVPSDIDGLHYVALRYGEVYSHLLEWVIDVRSINVDDEFVKLLSVFSELPLKAIEQIEAFPLQSIDAISQSFSDVTEGKIEKGSTVKLTLHLTIDDDAMSKYNEEMDILSLMFKKRATK